MDLGTANDLHNLDFVNDILACLKRRNVLFHECPAKDVALMRDGSLICWFQGTRAGKPWTGRVGFAVDMRGADLDQIAASNSPEAMSDAVEQIIDNEQARHIQ